MGNETTAVTRPAEPAGMGRLRDLSTTPYAACAAIVHRLQTAVTALERHSGLLQVAPLPGREWYELLTRKLLPQLGEDPFIVVAVVGGTNIGKSVVFNHLAGCRVSATSPLASGTKHPVCLVPPGFTARHDLQAIFQGFQLEEWTNSDAPLENFPDHHLFWQTNSAAPPNLLVLDTPDIDSDAAVNWVRADAIRHSADVLIALLTQQKYNDAAVKQFFRKAAAEDKAVIVLFNQCLLPEDEQYWPLWLATFSRETGIVPELVYLAPNDRRAAEANRLPFYLRSWPANEARGPAAEDAQAQPHDLRADLSEMHFAEIKIRTLRGSLRQLLSAQAGVPAYLEEIRLRSAEFRSAAELMTSQQLVRIQNWPTLPNRLLVNEIRHWWRMRREGWTRSVHDFYNALGEGVVRPFQWARSKLRGPEPDPLDAYRRQEREVMLEAIEHLYESLHSLSQLGNDLLRPRLQKLLAGEQRVTLIRQITEAHATLDLEADARDVVCSEMQNFRQESPQVYEFLKKLDSLTAAARPVTSVALFLAGGGPLGDAVAPLAHDAAAQVVLHIAGGTGAVLAGETALSSTSSGMRVLEAKFRQLQTAFTARRAAWFAALLKDHLLGSLQEELQTAAGLPRSPDFTEVEACLAQLERQVREEHAGPPRS